MKVQTEPDIVILMCIASELLGQAWMKPDKGNRAPHVLLVSKRFNEVMALQYIYLLTCQISREIRMCERYKKILLLTLTVRALEYFRPTHSGCT